MSETEVWVRSVRGLPPKPGPWHLVKRRSQRSWGNSKSTECGVYPDYRHERVDGRPEERLCLKCKRAARSGDR